MIRTGHHANGKTVFPDNATPLEIIATVNHINNSNLAAAKIDISLLPDFDGKEKIIALLAEALKVNWDALNEIYKLP